MDRRAATADNPQMGDRPRAAADTPRATAHFSLVNAFRDQGEADRPDRNGKSEASALCESPERVLEGDGGQPGGVARLRSDCAAIGGDRS